MNRRSVLLGGVAATALALSGCGLQRGGMTNGVRGRRGRTDSIAAVTPTWLFTPLTLAGASVSITELQPIAALLVEPPIVAVRAGSPYRTIKALQAKTGTRWTLLSFSGSGQRIAALLRNDAQMMIGAATDFADQVKVGAIRVIATVADRKVSAFPGLTSIRAHGIDAGVLPGEFRGFVGPPEMPSDALGSYQDVFAKLVKAPGWQDFVDENGSVTDFLDSKGFGVLLKKQNASLKTSIGDLGLGQQ